MGVQWYKAREKDQQLPHPTREPLNTGKPVTKHLAVSSEQGNEPPHMETPGEIMGTVGS